MNSFYTFGLVKQYACKNENQMDLVKTEFRCLIKVKGVPLGFTRALLSLDSLT